MIVSLSAHPLLQQICSMRGVVFIFGKICLVASVLMAHAVGDNLRLAEARKLPDDVPEVTPVIAAGAGSTELAAYKIVTSRNIFGKKPRTDDKTPSKAQPVSKLKLRLVGTNVSSTGNPFAIVEDISKKKQDVFELNEMIFKQAKLLEVLEESIKIERDGKVEVLVMKQGKRSSSTRGSSVDSNDDRTEFSVAEEELSDALANLPRLLSQARAVPYFRNGKSIGMRLFAIRRGSLYEKLGLKNGDIILSVNENSVSDPAQALKIFEMLKTERSINIQLERSGQNTELSYSIH